MSFGKEIYTLLLKHDVVIIPGFGAFVSEYCPAEINNESDEIKPPSKKITFNPLLKNNDGVLVGHIAEKLHISHFEALIRIEKEREDILFRLDKGETVDVDSIGTLKYNDQGEIVFVASGEENVHLDSFGLEPMPLNEPETEPENNSESEEDEDENLVEDDEPVEKITEPEVSADEETEEEIILLNEDTEDDQSGEVAAEAEALEETEEELTAENVEEEKRKRSPWLLIIILIVLIAVVVFALLKGFGDGKADKGNNNVKPELTETPEQTLVDTVVVDTLTTTVQDSVISSDSIPTVSKNSVEEVSPAQDTVKYYLVGGSFSLKENADNYLQELKGKGYDAFFVGKKGRFFIIGIASYKSFREADLAKQEYMENNPGSEVWVYRK